MPRVTNAASDHACCDACGEPNRTGTSVVYVSESWCRRHQLDWFEGLKLCIWCRHRMVSGGGVLTSKEDIRRAVARAKKWHEFKQDCKAKIRTIINKFKATASA